MPYTVAAAFDKFRQNIELSGDHRDTATARKDKIVSLLQKDFAIVEAFDSGSIPRFTALRKYADLDVIVALHYGKHIENKRPSEVLKSVQKCLADYKTGVRRNGQAVTLTYDTWPNVDIVPVSQSVNSDGSVSHYNVPDMNTETWLVSRPRTHSKDLTDRNSTCGEAFKRIIKMIKWWNHQHSEFLQSFHIEVIALKIFSAVLSDYPWDVYCYFKEAANLIQNPLRHGNDVVDGYLDYEKREAAKQRLNTARDKALQAWSLTYSNQEKHEEAISLWRQIFGDEFPAYGS